MRMTQAVLFDSLLLFVLGCGSGEKSKLPETVTAKGVVTLDGNPVDQASVVFIAESGNYHATGVTDSSGRFSLKAFAEKDGAVPGSYKVEVNKTVVTPAGSGGDEEAVNVQYGVPPKYATSSSSGLSVTIPKTGATDIKLELKSK